MKMLGVCERMTKKQLEFLKGSRKEKGNRYLIPLSGTLFMLGVAMIAAGLIWFRPQGGLLRASAESLPPLVPQTILRVHGSNTVGASLAPKLAEAYLTQLGARRIEHLPANKDGERYIRGVLPRGGPVDIEIHAHGSSTAFQDLEAGTCDIGAASRPIKREETERLGRLGFGVMNARDNEHVIALDGLAIIVHPSNPVAKLSVEEIAQIFSGEVANWSLVGGEDRAISLYTRNNKSGTFDTFKTLVLRKTRHLGNWALRFEDSNKLRDGVLGDPGGIGFIGLPYIGDAKPIAVSDGDSRSFRPSYATVKSEDYPLSRRLFFYTAESPKNPHVLPFLTLARSNEGQRLARETNLVDLSLSTGLRLAGVLDPASPERYLSMIRNAEYLSTLRFQSGENRLDSRAEDDLNRLVDFMKAPQNRDREIIIIGHTDTLGKPEINLMLSLERARSIQEILLAEGISVAVTDGFGMEVPVASNESPEGRQRNRRVEIFLGG